MEAERVGALTCRLGSTFQQLRWQELGPEVTHTLLFAKQRHLGPSQGDVPHSQQLSTGGGWRLKDEAATGGVEAEVGMAAAFPRAANDCGTATTIVTVSSAVIATSSLEGRVRNSRSLFSDVSECSIPTERERCVACELVGAWCGVWSVRVRCEASV